MNILKKNIIQEREYVLNDTFEIFKILNNHPEINKKLCFFGPIINLFQNKSDYQNANPNFNDLFHYLHYFHILNLEKDVNLKNLEKILLQNNIILSIEYSKKLKNTVDRSINFIIKKVKMSWDFYGGGEWYAYIFNYSCDNDDIIILEKTKLEYFINFSMSFYMTYDIFQNLKGIYYEQEFLTLFELIQKFKLEFIFCSNPIQTFNSVPIEIFHENEYKKYECSIEYIRNIYYFLYRILYKKYRSTLIQDTIIEIENFSYENCLICCEEDILSYELITLKCCHQEICLDCLTKLFLACHKYENFEKVMLYLPCPFCRNKMFCDSTFDCKGLN
jgi:hypothetical protein